MQMPTKGIKNHENHVNMTPTKKTNRGPITNSKEMEIYGLSKNSEESS